jgi:biotin transport system substrate-specific component
MRNQSPAALVACGLVAIAALSLASQLEVPMRPVPFTLQTLAVILVGFLLGPWLGFAATAAWLVAGALGLPVFSGSSGGIDSFAGPTAGYLLSFPFAAALAGWLGGNWRDSFAWARLFAAAIAAHCLTLAVGGAWLSTMIGVASAWEKGVLPFLFSAVLKSAAAVVLLKAAASARRTGAA